MSKFGLMVSDPPWFFFDRLKMSNTKRGAESQYKVMSDEDIINLNVKSIVADDAVLALWVPGSKLQVGLDCSKNWGFEVTQTWIWVKTKQNPLVTLEKDIFQIIKKQDPSEYRKLISEKISSFSLDDAINFFMGHCFRQTHELALVGTRGRYTKLLQNKSQRSVHISPALPKHSEKPEELQNRLDIMYPNENKLEMFARRDRSGYTCIGYDCPSTLKEDIRDSIESLAKMP